MDNSKDIIAAYLKANPVAACDRETVGKGTTEVKKGQRGPSQYQRNKKRGQ